MFPQSYTSLELGIHDKKKSVRNWGSICFSVFHSNKLYSYTKEDWEVIHFCFEMLTENILRSYSMGWCIPDQRRTLDKEIRFFYCRFNINISMDKYLCFMSNSFTSRT